MASDPSKTKDYDNQYDNAEFQTDRRVKDIAAAYTEYDEMKAYKMYLETLKVEAEVGQSTDEVISKIRLADGKFKDEKIKIKDLIPQQSEFEMARRMVIVKLNKADPSEVKRLFAEFETESMWVLSSKITNFLLDKSRRDRVADAYKFY